MNCYWCFSSLTKKSSRRDKETTPLTKAENPENRTTETANKKASSEGAAAPKNNKGEGHGDGGGNIMAETFSFRELAAATKNFREECLIGEGGFGRVYKGHLERTGQVVAVKQLNRKGLQGNKEFLAEVLVLSLLHHPNLVKLIGYCSDGDQRLLMYEYMPLGSLEDHLLDLAPGQPALPWDKRIKIAADAAKGLAHLHDKASPPIIFRDFKSSNILLDEEFNAKLSDFGLAELGPMGDMCDVSSKVMGTYGYCAPEYQKTGKLSVKADVYSFGVVLLELITGKRVVNSSKNQVEQNLISWAQPIFKEPRRFMELADPLLQGNFPSTSFNQAVAISSMCLLQDASIRPLMSDVVAVLSHLGGEPATDMAVPDPSPPMQPTAETESLNNGETTAAERRKAVAEALEWGTKSKLDA